MPTFTRKKNARKQIGAIARWGGRGQQDAAGASAASSAAKLEGQLQAALVDKEAAEAAAREAVAAMAVAQSEHDVSAALKAALEGEQVT